MKKHCTIIMKLLIQVVSTLRLHTQCTNSTCIVSVVTGVSIFQSTFCTIQSYTEDCIKLATSTVEISKPQDPPCLATLYSTIVQALTISLMRSLHKQGGTCWFASLHTACCKLYAILCTTSTSMTYA